jgi:hypothetical protein
VVNRLKTRPRLWPVLAYCFVCCAELGCVTTKRATIEPAPVLSKTENSILDLPINRVDIHGYRMHEALDKLAKAIETSSKGKYRFVIVTTWIKAKEYSQKYGSADIAGKWPTPNPYVHFQGINTNLRAVIDSLCQQSGWKYESTPIGTWQFYVDAGLTVAE